MNVQNRFGHLVKNKFSVSISQNILGSADFIKIGIHMLKKQINIFAIFSFDYLLQQDHIGMS